MVTSESKWFNEWTASRHFRSLLEDQHTVTTNGASSRALSGATVHPGTFTPWSERSRPGFAFTECMSKAVWVPRAMFQAGGLRCPACGRSLPPNAQTHYLEGTVLGQPIGAVLVCDSCSSSVRIWFNSPAEQA